MRASIGLLLAGAVHCAAAPQPPGSAAVAIQLNTVHIARAASPGLVGPRVPVETETDFLTSDPAAWYLLTYTGGHKGDKIRAEWRNPLGALAQQNDYIQVTDGNVTRLAWRLLIAGGPPSFAPGDWQVRLFWNDRGLSVTNFRISTPPDSTVNIVGQTLLPAGTTGAPYYFQLTARGGNPPYQWKALKSFPDGLTLSPTGTVTGAPLQRGSFRATVEAKDSNGNSVSRTLGIGIGVPAVGVRTGAHNLLRSPVPDACSQTAVQADFSASDASVVLATSVDAPKGTGGRVEWLNPRGEVSLLNRIPKPSDGPECIVETLPVAGQRAASDPGDWRVRLFWRDAEVFTLKFRIGGASGGLSAVAARRGRVAVVIGNLGYEKLPAPGRAASDLDLVEGALREDGFELVRKANTNLENLRQIERTLGDTLHAGDTVLVYYTGYGVRSGGDEWLLPVNYDPGDPRPTQSKAYSVLRLLQWLEDSKASLKFIVLDSAAVPGQPRENAGAVMGEVDDSTALVYSSPPGVAPKAGSPGPTVFARAFAEVLRKPGLDARNAIQIELPKAVARLAPSSPLPLASLGGGADFVFRAAATPGAVAPPAAVARSGEGGLNPRDGLRYVWIPAGNFQMGCSPGDGECLPIEMPPHRVRLTRGFWMAATETTVDAWSRFARQNSRAMPPPPREGENLLNPGWAERQFPMVNVSWEDARNYCGWAGGRLPTEAEWEYAARGGSPAARYGPLDEIAWYANNSGRLPLDGTALLRDAKSYAEGLGKNGNQMHPAAGKRPNGFGLFDMLGNVWEWVNDWGDDNYYLTSTEVDPRGPESGRARVSRGGTWYREAAAIRVSVRLFTAPGTWGTRLGFRCALDGIPAPANQAK